MTVNEKADLLQQLNQLAEHSSESDIEPNGEQLAGLLELNNDGPWHFVNLLSFHAEAKYPAGHELANKGMTGQQAYDEYGKVAFQHVMQRGGELITLNNVEACVIGQTGNWTRMATMKYPNIAAFLDMIQDPDYRAALVHRDAGLKETILLASQPLL